MRTTVDDFLSSLKSSGYDKDGARRIAAGLAKLVYLPVSELEYEKIGQERVSEKYRPLYTHIKDSSREDLALMREGLLRDDNGYVDVRFELDKIVPNDASHKRAVEMLDLVKATLDEQWEPDNVHKRAERIVELLSDAESSLTVLGHALYAFAPHVGAPLRDYLKLLPQDRFEALLSRVTPGRLVDVHQDLSREFNGPMSQVARVVVNQIAGTFEYIATEWNEHELWLKDEPKE